MNMPKSRKQDSFLWILTRNCEGTEQLQKENNTMVPIAHIENNFPTKFGIPRQSGRVGALKARIDSSRNIAMWMPVVVWRSLVISG